MRAFTRLIAVVAAGLAAFPAGAGQDVDAALAACRGEADAARRLACYDRVAGHSPPAAVSAAKPAAPSAASPAASPAATPAAPPAAPPAAAPPAAPAANAEQDFGLERTQAREEALRQEEKARALGELEAAVTRIETRFDGLMTITLDNGQVWRQNAPDSMFRLKQGDRVRIQPGSLKSYILSGPSKRSTRVTRVK